MKLYHRFLLLRKKNRNKKNEKKMFKSTIQKSSFELVYYYTDVLFIL